MDFWQRKLDDFLPMQKARSWAGFLGLIERRSPDG
jgi:hypothetical protein